MRKDEVIQYWMAEGLLELGEEANMVMEDIGNMYFNICWPLPFSKMLERMPTAILLVAKCMIWCMILHSQFQNLKL